MELGAKVLRLFGIFSKILGCSCLSRMFEIIVMLGFTGIFCALLIAYMMYTSCPSCPSCSSVHLPDLFILFINILPICSLKPLTIDSFSLSKNLFCLFDLRANYDWQCWLLKVPHEFWRKLIKCLGSWFGFTSEKVDGFSWFLTKFMTDFLLIIIIQMFSFHSSVYKYTVYTAHYHMLAYYNNFL